MKVTIQANCELVPNRKKISILAIERAKAGTTRLTINLDEQIVTCGSGDDCDLIIKDKGAGFRQFAIDQHDRRIFIQDFAREDPHTWLKKDPHDNAPGSILKTRTELVVGAIFGFGDAQFEVTSIEP